jgi:hypothetical protein
VGARADLLLTSTRTSTPIAVQPAARLRSGDPAVVEAGTPPGRRHDRVRGQSARPIGTLVTIAVGRLHSADTDVVEPDPHASYVADAIARALHVKGAKQSLGAPAGARSRSDAYERRRVLLSGAVQLLARPGCWTGHASADSVSRPSRTFAMYSGASATPPKHTLSPNRLAACIAL